MANNPVINNFNAGELSPYLYARTDLNKYNSGCLELENFQILPYGGATRRPSIEYIAASKADDKVRLIPFEFSSTQTYILEMGDEYIRFYKDGEQLESGGSPYEISTDYAAADLFDIKYVQSADVMWMAHPDYPVQRLERTGDTSWSIADADFDFPALLEENNTATTITPSGTTGSITLTASTSIFDANHVGSTWLIKHLRTDNVLSVVGAGNKILAKGTVTFTTTGTWGNEDVTVWRSDDDGTSWEQFRKYNMDGRNVDVSWEEAEENIYYYVSYTGAGTSGKFRLFVNEYYYNGLVEITGFTSGTVVSGTVVSDLGDTAATKRWAEGAWSAFRGYPQALALFETRLVYAGTLNKPNTLWLSVTDDFQNLRTGSLDTDGFKITLGSGRIDEIRWMVPQRALVIGTVGSEWVLEAESDNKALTPTSFALRRKTTYGSKSLQATLINSAVLFIMRQGRKLREFTYRFDVDDYVAPDLTILSEHITEGGITNTAYQQQPDNVLHSIRTDGQMIPMTYERDQEVTGWYRWTLDDGDGEFESIAVIPKDNDEDEVWVSGKITVDGTDKRYIGRFDNREWGDDVATEYTGSDFYKVYTKFEQDGAKTAVVSDCYDSGFDGTYTYNTSTEKWEKGSYSIYKSGTWFMTDGTLTYEAADNGSDIPPAWFTRTQTYPDTVTIPEQGGNEDEFILGDYSRTNSKRYDSTEEISPGVPNPSYIYQFDDYYWGVYADTYQSAEWNSGFISENPPKGGWYSLAGFSVNPIVEYTIPSPTAKVTMADTTISGLDYLEGKTVDVLRDGMALPRETVSGGEIEIDKVGDRVVIGLPYTSTMAPMYVEPILQFQQPMGKKKGLFKAVVRFKDTIHAKVGQSKTALRTVLFRTTGDELDEQVEMFSGEKKIAFENEYEFLHTCYVIQDKPLPITVVAMIPYVKVNR